jgi:hypothetical protein
MQFTHHCHSRPLQEPLSWQTSRLAVKPKPISYGWLPVGTAVAESEERTS